MQIVRRELIEDVLENVDEDHIPDEHQATLDMVSEEGITDGDDEDGSGEEDESYISK